MIDILIDIKVLFRNMERKTVLFISLLLFCFTIAIVLLRFYFASYSQPYMMKDIVNLSAGWSYSTNGSNPVDSHTVPVLNAGETLVLYQALDEAVEDAAIMVRANHQTVNIYLDDRPLYIDRKMSPDENPGMALHFIPLPENYLHKTLRVEVTSPYADYSGRIGAVLMGALTSLEAYVISQSMPSVIMMAMCLLLGFATIALSFLQALRGERRPGNLAIGLFALIWALYWVNTEYIVFQFFTPFWMSAISICLYFSFQAPLALFFYFSFQRYKKWMLPAVILHTGFPAAAILLQISGVVDLPRLITLNNIFLAGLAYTLALSILEAFGKNRIDRILTGINPEWLTPVITGMAALAFLSTVVSLLHTLYVFKIRVKLAIVANAGFFWHGIGLSV